jgi:DHA3 family multidrug efflux protein-like MFS transporter
VLGDVGQAPLWALIVLIMLGVIAGNIRSIALPTLVTALIPEDRRDRANGLVGMITGVGFLGTSVISGFLVAWGGMVATLAFALIFSAAAFLHLLFVPLRIERASSDAPTASRPSRGRSTSAAPYGSSPPCPASSP